MSLFLHIVKFHSILKSQFQLITCLVYVLLHAQLNYYMQLAQLNPWPRKKSINWLKHSDLISQTLWSSGSSVYSYVLWNSIPIFVAIGIIYDKSSLVFRSIISEGQKVPLSTFKCVIGCATNNSMILQTFRVMIIRYILFKVIFCSISSKRKSF